MHCLCVTGKTFQGFKTHNTRLHKPKVNNMEQSKQKGNHSFKIEDKKSNIKKILAYGGSQFLAIKQDFYDYQKEHITRNASQAYPKLFKVKYNGPLTFENFSKKSMEEKKKAKSTLQHLISKKDLKTIDFWKCCLKIFNSDFKSHSIKNNLQLEDFNPQNFNMADFEKQVKTFRKQVNYCYNHLIELFNVQNISQEKNITDDLRKNRIYEALTLNKLRMEYINEIGLARFYHQKKAHTVLSYVNDAMNGQNTTQQERKNRVKVYQNYANDVANTISQIKKEYMPDYKAIISSLEDHLKNHKNEINLICSGSFLLKENQSNIVTCFPPDDITGLTGDESEIDDGPIHDTPTNIIKEPTELLPPPPPPPEITLKHIPSAPPPLHPPITAQIALKERKSTEASDSSDEKEKEQRKIKKVTRRKFSNLNLLNGTN